MKSNVLSSIQGSGYPSAHVPGAGFPPQASVLDPHETWNHHRQEVPVWSPNMEVSEQKRALVLWMIIQCNAVINPAVFPVCQDGGALGRSQAMPTAHLMEETLMKQQQQMEEDQRWLEQEESFLVLTHSMKSTYICLSHTPDCSGLSNSNFKYLSNFKLKQTINLILKVMEISGMKIKNKKALNI